MKVFNSDSGKWSFVMSHVVKFETETDEFGQFTVWLSNGQRIGLSYDRFREFLDELHR